MSFKSAPLMTLKTLFLSCGLLLLVCFCLSPATLVSALKMGSEEDMSHWQREVARVRNYTAERYLTYVSGFDNVTTLPSGLRLTVMKRGHGDVAPSADDVCDVHYTIYYRHPGVVEDTRLLPYAVKRRPSDLVPGMKEAMELMREGDRFYLYLPYFLAYGSDGSLDKKVTPYMNLRCDFEVFKCVNPKGKTSEEIDAFLQPYLKLPMPPKTPAINYDDL